MCRKEASLEEREQQLHEKERECEDRLQQITELLQALDVSRRGTAPIEAPGDVSPESRALALRSLEAKVPQILWLVRGESLAPVPESAPSPAPPAASAAAVQARPSTIADAAPGPTEAAGPAVDDIVEEEHQPMTISLIVKQPPLWKREELLKLQVWPFTHRL